MIAHNAQLSSPKRDYQLSAQHRNHQTQRKTKMPRVEGLLELFVSCLTIKPKLIVITARNDCDSTIINRIN